MAVTAPVNLHSYTLNNYQLDVQGTTEFKAYTLNWNQGAISLAPSAAVTCNSIDVSPCQAAASASCAAPQIVIGGKIQAQTVRLQPTATLVLQDTVYKSPATIVAPQAQITFKNVKTSDAAIISGGGNIKVEGYIQPQASITLDTPATCDKCEFAPQGEAQAIVTDKGSLNIESGSIDCSSSASDSQCLYAQPAASIVLQGTEEQPTILKSTTINLDVQANCIIPAQQQIVVQQSSKVIGSGQFVVQGDVDCQAPLTVANASFTVDSSVSCQDNAAVIVQPEQTCEVQATTIDCAPQVPPIVIQPQPQIIVLPPPTIVVQPPPKIVVQEQATLCVKQHIKPTVIKAAVVECAPKAAVVCQPAATVQVTAPSCIQGAGHFYAAGARVHTAAPLLVNTDCALNYGAHLKLSPHHSSFKVGAKKTFAVSQSVLSCDTYVHETPNIVVSAGSSMLCDDNTAAVRYFRPAAHHFKLMGGSAASSKDVYALPADKCDTCATTVLKKATIQVEATAKFEVKVKGKVEVREESRVYGQGTCSNAGKKDVYATYNLGCNCDSAPGSKLTVKTGGKVKIEKDIKIKIKKSKCGSDHDDDDDDDKDDDKDDDDDKDKKKKSDKDDDDDDDKDKYDGKDWKYDAVHFTVSSSGITSNAPVGYSHFSAIKTQGKPVAEKKQPRMRLSAGGDAHFELAENAQVAIVADSDCLTATEMCGSKLSGFYSMATGSAINVESGSVAVVDGSFEAICAVPGQSCGSMTVTGTMISKKDVKTTVPVSVTGTLSMVADKPIQMDVLNMAEGASLVINAGNGGIAPIQTSTVQPKGALFVNLRYARPQGAVPLMVWNSQQGQFSSSAFTLTTKARIGESVRVEEDGSRAIKVPGTLEWQQKQLVFTPDRDFMNYVIASEKTSGWTVAEIAATAAGSALAVALVGILICRRRKSVDHKLLTDSQQSSANSSPEQETRSLVKPATTDAVFAMPQQPVEGEATVPVAPALTEQAALRHVPSPPQKSRHQPRKSNFILLSLANLVKKHETTTDAIV